MNWKKALRPVKRGRRFYGAVFQLSGDRLIYMARRKNNAEIFRGAKSVSEAIDEGTACWALDDDTIRTLRLEGVTLVGVFVQENGDTYITTLANYLDRSRAKALDYQTRGGALQWYLPLTFFARQAGATRFK